jgi:adenylyl cyclase-associated protein
MIKPDVLQSTVPSKKPSKFVLENNKWQIENWIDSRDLVVDQVELRHSVYIFNCINCIVYIKGKLNQVTIGKRSYLVRCDSIIDFLPYTVDACQKTTVVTDKVISSIEMVNSSYIQLQILDKSPTVIVDKSDSVQIVLSENSLDTELFTSKSSTVNVMIPEAGNNYVRNDHEGIGSTDNVLECFL